MRHFQGDYFVYENETLDCFTGMTDQQFDLVPIRTEGGKVYVNMGKIIDLMALITVRLHTVTQTENWKKHIYSSESLIQAGLPMPYYVDCAYFCLKVDIDKCQFFIFLENTCHLGSYDTTDGDLDVADTTLQVYFKTETLNTVKFDGNFTLPGSLWNEYILWNIALETANTAEECTGFCYFQHPDPIECSFAVADTTNAMCYLGSMESTAGQGGYSETNALTIDTDFVGTIESSSVDAWIAIHYNTYQTTRWTPMVYEVSSEKSLQFCALYCYSRPEKQCQFFFHTGTDCNLGSFSSSDSASSTSGHHTIHINYNAVSDTDEFLETTYDYSLADVKSNLMSRLMSVNTDAVSTEYECAAFCQVAYPDCYFYLFESICHAGSLDQTSGSFAGTAGSKTLTFDNERTTTFLNNYYTIKKSLTGRVWGAASYEEKSIVEIKDCQMYCFLDNVQPCHAYWAENTECHLYFFTPVSKADQPEDSKELNWNSATLDTLLNAQFTSEYSSGSYWTQYIYETVSGIDDLTQCKLVCYTDTQCDYCAFHGGICYLGDFSTTESVTGVKGTDYVYHRSRKYSSKVEKILCPSKYCNISEPTDGLLDDALDLYETNTKFRSSIWPKFVYTYISSGGNEWLCAAKCALRYTNCHFYWHSGSYCYIGDFTRHPYTYLGDTNAPIKVLKGRYGMLLFVCNFLCHYKNRTAERQRSGMQCQYENGMAALSGLPYQCNNAALFS